MKYEVGDQFLIKLGEQLTGSDNKPLWRVEGFNSLVFDETGLDKLKHYTQGCAMIDGSLQEIQQKCYQKGLENAWKAAKMIMNMNIHDRIKFFDLGKNSACFKDISEKYTVIEAINKLNEYILVETYRTEVGDKDAQ